MRIVQINYIRIIWIIPADDNANKGVSIERVISRMAGRGADKKTVSSPKKYSEQLLKKGLLSSEMLAKLRAEFTENIKSEKTTPFSKTPRKPRK